MKRIVNYSLMLLILITVVCVTVLFAQNIIHNNVKDNVENIGCDSGGCDDDPDDPDDDAVDDDDDEYYKASASID